MNNTNNKQSYRISALERDSLYGLPHLQQLVYFTGIRPYMDFVTGVVGEKRRISYQSLRESLYVEPKPGQKSFLPSKDQMRRAVAGLARAGVVEVRSSHRHLILTCNLADHDRFTQNKAATFAPSEVDTLKPKENADLNGCKSRTTEKATIDESVKPATPPVSGNNLSHTHRSVFDKTAISNDFEPNELLLSRIRLSQCTKFHNSEERTRFIAYHQSKGTKSCDWGAEYLLWLLNTKRYQERGRQHATRKNANSSNQQLSPSERVKLANKELFSEELRIIDIHQTN
jgi:hypothetical protein